MSARRLRIELDKLESNPAEGIVARPLESNILDWRYVIRGSDDSPYEGGQYYGKIKFPHTYPLAPPSILMLTPSGRFEPNMRICMSMSDYHPESWNPAWSVGKILIGLVSFMNSEELTTGGIKSDKETRKALAKKSWEFNAKDKVFKEVFPEDFDVLMAEQDAKCEAARLADLERARNEEEKQAKEMEKRERTKVQDEAEAKRKERNRIKNQKKKQRAKEKKLQEKVTMEFDEDDGHKEGKATSGSS